MDYSEFVPKVHFEQIPIKYLVSNQDYQRNLSQNHIKRAAENFDIYQINPVKVSRRDGVNYVFNGQHTIEIIALVSGSRDTPVWCMVYDDLVYQHEADIFANQQKFIKPLHPYEIFIANVEAGNDEQLIIRDIVESYGLKLGVTKGPNTIVGVGTLEKIFEKYGYHVLDQVLRLIVGTWEGDVNSLYSNMIKAVCKLVITYGDALDEELFKQRLSLVSLKMLFRTAKERHPGTLGVAEAMIIEYNGKRKSPHTRLSINRLHQKEEGVYEEDVEDDEGED